MFVKVTDSGYIEEGEENEGAQFAEGDFLLIAADHTAGLGVLRPELRALILPEVRMEQLGHFMMANAKLEDGRTLTLSGTFGNDSLPVDLGHKGVPDLWDMMHPIPQEVQNAFWEDKNQIVGMWAAATAQELVCYVIEAEYIEGE
jgi:hypothetical protein